MLGQELQAALHSGPRWCEGRQWGSGLDERVVELPWIVAHLGRCGRLLDVGSALNSPLLVRLLLPRCREVVFLNPFPDDGYRAADGGVSYVSCDVRSSWLAAGSFDLVTCISTLEHIGCDNARYGATAGREPDPAAARVEAMHAMRALCADGARMLLTVPVGNFEDHGWFVQFDQSLLEAAIKAFNPSAVRVEWFVHDGAWRAASPTECTGIRYASRTRGAGAVACVELQA